LYGWLQHSHALRSPVFRCLPGGGNPMSEALFHERKQAVLPGRLRRELLPFQRDLPQRAGSALLLQRKGSVWRGALLPARDCLCDRLPGPHML
jgi:hypothetical protein